MGATGELTFYFGVAAEVVGEAVCDDVALTHDLYPFGNGLTDLGVEDGVMGATEDDSVDFGIGSQ